MLSRARIQVSAKLETDSDWSKFVQDVTSTEKPSADLISSAVYSEIPPG